MKPLVIILLLLLALTSEARPPDTSVHPGSSSRPAPKQRYNRIPYVNPNANSDTNQDYPRGHLGWALGNQTTPAVMVDPYRIINGRTNAVGTGWIIFTGRVIGGTPDGVAVDGAENTVPKSDDLLGGPFFVANYPYPCVMDGIIGSTAQWYYAWPSGMYVFTNNAGVVMNLRRLDYGEVWTPPPPTPEQLAAREKVKADAKAALDARFLHDDQTYADNGDPDGLLHMGRRYRDGKGVDRDTAKALVYLQRAADAGSDTAKVELEMLLSKLKPKE